MRAPSASFSASSRAVTWSVPAPAQQDHAGARERGGHLRGLGAAPCAAQQRGGGVGVDALEAELARDRRARQQRRRVAHVWHQAQSVNGVARTTSATVGDRRLGVGGDERGPRPRRPAPPRGRAASRACRPRARRRGTGPDAGARAALMAGTARTRPGSERGGQQRGDPVRRVLGRAAARDRDHGGAGGRRGDLLRPRGGEDRRHQLRLPGHHLLHHPRRAGPQLGEVVGQPGRAGHASSSSEIGSPTRIVPERRMSARRPPRWTSARRTPGRVRRWRWAQGSQRRRPTSTASPTRKRRPISPSRFDAGRDHVAPGVRGRRAARRAPPAPPRRSA